VSEKPTIIVVDPCGTIGRQTLDPLCSKFQLMFAPDLAEALDRLRSSEASGVLLGPDQPELIAEAGGKLGPEKILNAVSDGIAVVDGELNIQWANREFIRLAVTPQVSGGSFYEVLGSPEPLGPDFWPFRTTFRTGQTSSTVLRIGNRYVRLCVSPLERNGQPEHAVALTRDVSDEVHQQQKLAAIHAAGMELTDINPDELASLGVEDRIELLKNNILHHTKHLLHLTSFEIRMLDQETGELRLVVQEGMSQEAIDRKLYARLHGNGVTGFVAVTGESYLCDDTEKDHFYLPGAPNAKSSITVPLIWHDQVIGTFNVESPEPHAFTEQDLQFLEIFARDVAHALHTLELIHAQEVTAASRSVDLISREVALPVDDILRDATAVLERYIGHEPDVAERLKRIVEHARQIKQLIQKVGERIQPTNGTQLQQEQPISQVLQGLHILLVDKDEAVRRQIHELIGRLGCTVETASCGREALIMAKLTDYDVIIVDIRLPDMTGYEVYKGLRRLRPDTAVVLMTGFGYDPEHSIVKARSEGLRSVLFKPFGLDRLIEAVEGALCTAEAK